MTFKEVHSTPIFVFNKSIHNCGTLVSPYELCGPLVGWSWPTLIYLMMVERNDRNMSLENNSQ